MGISVGWGASPASNPFQRRVISTKALFRSSSHCLRGLPYLWETQTLSVLEGVEGGSEFRSGATCLLEVTCTNRGSIATEMRSQMTGTQHINHDTNQLLTTAPTGNGMSHTQLTLTFAVFSMPPPMSETSRLPNMAEETVTSTIRKWYDMWSVKPGVPSRCDDEQLTQQQKALFDSLGEGIKDRYFGTGLVIPENVQGKRILDIGCGAGSLVFILSKLVGPTGYIIGIDVCDGAIQTARDQSEYHWKQWGYDKPNFEFRVLNADHLGEGNFQDEEFDIIVSSGVLCMLPNQERAIRATYTLLKPGGLFYMNDIMAEQDTPEKCRDIEILCAEGITRAMRSDSLAVMAQAAGFTIPHLTSVAPIAFVSQEHRNMLELGRYTCAGWRLFKLDPSRAKWANNGPALVTYNGGITDYPDAFPWDVDLTFKKGEGVEVDEELATLLSSIYLSDCFSFKPASWTPRHPPALEFTGSMTYDALACKAWSTGFTTPHRTSAAPVPITNDQYNTMIEYRGYTCASWRLFKLDPSRAEGTNRGPALVTYNGGITGYPDAFPWDVDLTFKAQNPFQLMHKMEAEGKLPEPICTFDLITRMSQNHCLETETEVWLPAGKEALLPFARALEPFPLAPHCCS